MKLFVTREKEDKNFEKKLISSPLNFCCCLGGGRWKLLVPRKSAKRLAGNLCCESRSGQHKFDSCFGFLLFL